MARGMETGEPSKVESSEIFDTSTITRCLKIIASRSVALRADGALVIRAAIGVIENRFRDSALREPAKIVGA